MRRLFSWNSTILISALLGVACGYVAWAPLNPVVDGVAEIFMRLLKLIGVPLIFLSLLSTLASMRGSDVQVLGRKVLKYTLATTWIAACIGLALFVMIWPVGSSAEAAMEPMTTQSYFSYLGTIIPSNFLQPFVESQVMGVLFLALLLSVAVQRLPTEHQEPLVRLFSASFAVVMEIARLILMVMPIAIWAFAVIFVRDFCSSECAGRIGLYLICVVAANVIQAVVVLPLFVWWRGGSPMKLVRGMLPGLTVAFFSKSSSAALPVVMECAEKRVGMREQISRFSFPLCATVNMNACAAFILITVLFVSMSNGVTYSGWELMGWTFVASLAAVGNAGVPMGCYMLSSAFLAAMGVPLELLALILPLYSLLDMLESAINVWSDACVAHMVDLEVPA